MKQVESGKAFEYGIAKTFSSVLGCVVESNSSYAVAKNCFEKVYEDERKKIRRAAEKAVDFLCTYDANLMKNSIYNNTDGAYKIVLQADSEGKRGDVRDIIIYNLENGVEIGVSVKNRHTAVKHSRLSGTISFGKEWLGIDNSELYHKEILPVFQELRERRLNKEEWKEIPDKKEKFYKPVLLSFRDELKRLYEIDSIDMPVRLIRYILGLNDFYKIIKVNGSVSFQSFNFSGLLKWGNKIPLPKRIIEAELKENSGTTLSVVFDSGWQLSFRIHNASSRVEPSLKFDIQIVGLPPQLARNEIHY